MTTWLKKDKKLPTKTDHLLMMFQDNMKAYEDGLLVIPVQGIIQSRSIFMSKLACEWSRTNNMDES